MTTINQKIQNIVLITPINTKNNTDKYSCYKTNYSKKSRV